MSDLQQIKADLAQFSARVDELTEELRKLGEGLEEYLQKLN